MLGYRLNKYIVHSDKLLVGIVDEWAPNAVRELYAN